MTREEAINILWMYDVNFEPHPAEEVMHAIDMAIEALRQPERKTGRWMEKEVFHEVESSTPIEQWQSAKCSVCGKYHTTPYLYYFDEYAFCPNCGADMRKEGEADEGNATS